MDADERHEDESPAIPRRLKWLLAVGAVVILAVVIPLAVTNPGEQAHRTALAGKTHCRYHNFLLFSTMTTIDLSGEQRRVSTGFLGKVTVADDAQAR